MNSITGTVLKHLKFKWETLAEISQEIKSINLPQDT